MFTNHTLNAKQRLLVGLRFLATNSPYFSVGDAEHVSKKTVFQCVKRLIVSFNEMKNIDWPLNEYECRKIAIDFFNKSKGKNKNLPGLFR